MSSVVQSAFTRNRLVIGAIALAVAGAWFWWSHHTYVEDVREICSAESRTETSIVVSRHLIEMEAAAKLRSGSGSQLLESMKAAPPHDAALLLRHAATGVGVSDCVSAASYDKLAARKALNDHAQAFCRHLDPVTVAKVPREKRAAFVVQWAHEHTHEDDLDAMLAPIATLPLDQAAPRIKEILSSDADVHACGFLPGLLSPVSPQSGPNVIVQSAGVPNDERDKAMMGIFQDKGDDFIACYKQGIAKDPNISGTLKLKFRLTDKGVIDFALAQTDSTLHSPTTTTCATDLVKTIHGPAGKATSAGGVVVEFWNAP